MVKTTITWRRETTEIEWWTSIVTDSYKEYVKNKYKVTGKRLSSKLVLSKDKLSLTSETVFANQQAFEEFSSDPIIRAWANTRKEYCIKNSIQESSRIIEQN